ncbi:phospholipase A1-like [Uranotaenia lowii]|uniref:phospholipase A1-like n=1 Tax=Uranotaenia lowii TaxID=190385 RepID=UPI002479B01B|nr:phospholipase A1-like [Uranotaenia lowii]
MKKLIVIGTLFLAACVAAREEHFSSNEVGMDYEFGCDRHYLRAMEEHIRNPIRQKRNVQIDPLNASFHLNTRLNVHETQVLNIGDIQSVMSSNFNASIPTRIIVHGFCNCRHSDFCLTTKDAFLERAEYNVITVNWQSGKQLNDYWIARKRIHPTAEKLAKLIDFLNEKAGLRFEDLYLVGHSLGAHLSGLTGKAVRRGKINTIIALDPAKPMFDMGKPTDRLAETDANYVEVIHTNGGKLGLFDPVGHTDFYPNGGQKQPGCWGWWFGSSCSHGRAWEFYAESIVSMVGFWSTRCDSLNQVSPAGCRSPKAKLKMGGEPIVAQNRGILTVETHADAPYARGKLDIGSKRWRLEKKRAQFYADKKRSKKLKMINEIY